jgi:hypothetical protein
MAGGITRGFHPIAAPCGRERYGGLGIAHSGGAFKAAVCPSSREQACEHY